MEEEYTLTVQFYNDKNQPIINKVEKSGKSENELREVLASLIKVSKHRLEWQIRKTIQIASGTVEVNN